MQPETKYARSGDYHIAYQVVGDGPSISSGLAAGSPISSIHWENPGFARLYQRLASFSRLILFDKRGVGMSDRVPMHELPTLEERMDDVRAVMDAVGSDKAILLGASEGGPMAMLFAATYPDRVSGLITYASFARRTWAPDYPYGLEARAAAGISRRYRAELGNDSMNIATACPEPAATTTTLAAGSSPEPSTWCEPRRGRRAAQDEFPDRRPTCVADYSCPDADPASRRRSRVDVSQQPLPGRAHSRREVRRVAWRRSCLDVRGQCRRDR